MRVAAIPTYIESTDSLIPQHACRNESIIRTPPFPGKMINNYCIQSFRTLTFEIIIPISEHLHLAELDRESTSTRLCLCGTPTEFAERILAFDSF